jgi:hypothetical protein
MDLDANAIEDRFVKGEAAMRKHQWAYAIGHFEAILGSEPNNIDALNCTALCR